jgi:hypothetical protein
MQVQSAAAPLSPQGPKRSKVFLAGLEKFVTALPEMSTLELLWILPSSLCAAWSPGVQSYSRPCRLPEPAVRCFPLVGRGIVTTEAPLQAKYLCTYVHVTQYQSPCGNATYAVVTLNVVLCRALSVAVDRRPGIAAPQCGGPDYAVLRQLDVEHTSTRRWHASLLQGHTTRRVPSETCSIRQRGFHADVLCNTASQTCPHANTFEADSRERGEALLAAVHVMTVCTLPRRSQLCKLASGQSRHRSPRTS